MNSKDIDYKQAKEILKKPWITYEEIYITSPGGQKNCREKFNETKKRAIQKNMLLPNVRPAVVPTSIYLELYPPGG